MTAPPSTWQSIIDMLHDSLPPNGPDGFEGLIATILSELTSKPFFVAATGRQPQGDAISHDVRISIQAKQYGQKTSLDANKVIADFHAVRAATNYGLDVYIVAVTRETAQLRAELEPCQRETGVDIVVLADSAESPELSALCVAFWSKVKRFFPSVSADLETWIKSKKDDEKVRTALVLSRTKISEGLNTFTDLRELGRNRIARKFRPSESDINQAGVQIQLSDAVARKGASEALQKWWIQNKEPNAYVEAEEGCGKSWVAAAFSEELASDETAPIVLWLESLDWTGAKTLDEVVAAGLRTVLPIGDTRTAIFSSKIFRVWPRPALLVLDGVNEQGCLESAQRILWDYAHHDDHYSKHIRLLFTTRPLSNYPKFNSCTWTNSRRIPLTGFTDSEFAEALSRFASDLAPESIPPNVRKIASIPRFFNLALKLRERLRDLGQLTKPILLFADLIDKIERSSQLRQLFAGAR